MIAETAILMAMESNPKYIAPITIESIEEEIVEEDQINEDELDLLARLITAECGSDWCSDDMLYFTGSVVLNRINSDYYPSTMYDVIYQSGQYAVVDSGTINNEPNIRALHAAEDLLTSGSCLPDDVLYQSNFIQGSSVYKVVQNMYFCRR